jgi:exodeoxyribonuclease VII small subunit
MSSKTKPREAELNFEGAMDRLEKIVEQMESGKLPLEDLIVRYEEGMNLVKVCHERLANTEQKIEIIARNSAGKPVVKSSSQRRKPLLQTKRWRNPKAQMTKSTSSETSQTSQATATPPRLLDGIRSPADIKTLREQDLPQLAQEVRDELIKVLSQTGGHLGPNLGVVELTIALHRVFNTPRDRFVMDVSHQVYVHKMFTGRLDRFHTMRQFGGLNGFL